MREHPVADQHGDHDGADQQRDAGERELEEPEPPHPRLARRRRTTSTLTGLPVSASRAPAWAPNASGISSCEVGSRTRMAITTTTGTRAATAPLTLMSAVTSAQITMIERRPPAIGPSPARATSCWPTQAVTPGGVERLAHDEQRGDVDHGRIAEPAERLVEVEHVRGPERRAPRAMATTATGSRFQTKRTTAPPRIRNVMVLSAMQVSGRPAGDDRARRADVGQSDPAARADQHEARGRRRRRCPRRARPRRRSASVGPERQREQQAPARQATRMPSATVRRISVAIVVGAVMSSSSQSVAG